MGISLGCFQNNKQFNYFGIDVFVFTCFADGMFTINQLFFCPVEQYHIKLANLRHE